MTAQATIATTLGIISRQYDEVVSGVALAAMSEQELEEKWKISGSTQRVSRAKKCRS